MEKVQGRTQDERGSLQTRLQLLESDLRQRQDDLNAKHAEVNTLKDENHRLKSAVVNKDSENVSLQQFLEKEKERRVAETGELRRMLSEE